MKLWQSTLCYVVIFVWPGKNARLETSPFTGINTILREYLGQSTPDTSLTTYSSVSQTMEKVSEKSIVINNSENLSAQGNVLNKTVENSVSVFSDRNMKVYTTATPTELSSKIEGIETPKGYPVVHAAVPRGLAVYPVPLHSSHHELAFNVTWEPPLGPPVRGYSLEVNSTTMTVDCHSNLCYEYNIPGMARWKVVPEYPSPVPEGCAVRPGCAYRVRLIAHPWDGHTSANLDVELDECVAGVCSCAHSRRLPAPVVTARALFMNGELYVNVTWSLPPPPEPLRLPPRLRKQFYFISIGKQMVSHVHPAPWYPNIISRRVNATGFVAVPEDRRWLLLPVIERSGERGVERSGKRGGQNRDKNEMLRNIVLDMKLLARVSLIDERGCVGPAGNATAYDPDKVSKASIGSYILWAVFGGTVVFATMVILAVGARAIKRVLKAFRPPPTDPLQPLRQRPNWFPLQMHA